MITVSQISIRAAGPERTSQGAQFGFGGMLISFFALLFGPISLITFIITRS